MKRSKKVGYAISGKLLSDFTEAFGIDLNSNGCISGSVEGKHTFLSEDAGEGMVETLGEFMALAATSSDYVDLFDGMKEWEALSKWNESELKKLPKTPYEDYTFQTKLDGSDESIVKLIHELFVNTDFSTRISIERKLERICQKETEAYLCGWIMADGDEIITHPNEGNKISYYRAYMLDASTGEESTFIEYNFGELSIVDFFGADSDDSFDDESIRVTIDNIQRYTLYGLEKIKKLECDYFSRIEIPETCMEICENVFNCDMVEEIIVRRTNTRFHENAIPVPDGITLVGYKGSSAEIYAKEHGVNFTALPDEKVPTQRQQLDEHLSILLPVESTFKMLESTADSDEEKEMLEKFDVTAHLTMNCPVTDPGEIMTLTLTARKGTLEDEQNDPLYLINYGKLGDTTVECGIGEMKPVPFSRHHIAYQITPFIRFCKDDMLYAVTGNKVHIKVPMAESNNAEVITDKAIECLELFWKLIDGMTYDGMSVTVDSDHDRDTFVYVVEDFVDIYEPDEALQQFVEKFVLSKLGAEKLSDLNPLSRMIYDRVYKEAMEKIKSDEL